MHSGRTAVAAGIGIAAAGVLLAAAVGAVAYQDREGPEIIVQQMEAAYSLSMTTGDLIQNVSAVDRRDGDVTDSLIVEKIDVSQDGQHASVVYAAADHSGNVTKLVWDMPCAQDGGETQAVTESAGEQAAVQDETSAAQDPEGQPAMTGDGEEEPTAEQPVDPAAPRLTLSAHEVNVAQGTEFTALSYVQEITDDSDSQEMLYGQIQISGHVDTAVPGSYELVYFVTDSDGNRSNEERLMVAVQ